MSLLEDLKTIVDASGLFTGFEHSYFGLNDESSSFLNADNWTAFKVDGGGSIDPAFGQPMVRLWAGGKRGSQLSRYNKLNAFINFVNDNTQSGDIFHILVQSDIKGPFARSGDRSLFEIHLRLSQNRG